MGLSMGTHLSSYLASLYMDFIEQSALNIFHLKHSLWFRFVDDILSVWEHGQDSLEDFLVHLNSFDSNLQFTMEVEDSGKLPFLNVLIIKILLALNFLYTGSRPIMIGICTFRQITFLLLKEG
jgi:hypothetical protein